MAKKRKRAHNKLNEDQNQTDAMSKEDQGQTRVKKKKVRSENKAVHQ